MLIEGRTPTRLASLLPPLLCVGCMGLIGDPGESPDSQPELDPLGDDVPPELHLAEVGLRRLSSREYEQTVRDLLGASSAEVFALLPEDAPEEEQDWVFDNNYETQIASRPLVEGAETLAGELAARTLADPTLRDALVGCAPTGPDDTACMRAFVERFGLAAFRRPLSADEVARYLAMQQCPDGTSEEETPFCGFAIQANDFWFGVETIVLAMLESPHFLYRVEVGEPVPGADGVFRLDDYEVATRLSYFLWGTTPDQWLLDLAGSGGLGTSDAVRDAARTMLEDPRGHRQVQRFHAQWLGHESIAHEGELAEAMIAETEALVERVVFDSSYRYPELFTSRETYVDAATAAHYGLDPPSGDGSAWVAYDEGRGGVFSHGSFLSIGTIGDADTRPVHRGKYLTTVILCQPIPPPPANVPEPPTREEVECKMDILEQHSQGGCAGCHVHMDGIGLGLEGYDALGRFRTHEDGLPECALPGRGVYAAWDDVDETDFTGPRELGELVVQGGRVETCASLQLLRSALGRNVMPRGGARPHHEEDLAFAAWLGQRLHETGRFDEVILDLVSSPLFLHRVEPRDGSSETSTEP
jgi:hypothetical protein